jgi:redox-regulated HSP33 family molecular chaperone
VANDQQRAEEAVKEAERLAKDAATQAGGFLLRVLARAREEVEDVWAEAQSISRPHQ